VVGSAPTTMRFSKGLVAPVLLSGQAKHVVARFTVVMSGISEGTV
jgi:hypothetical protein